MLRLLDLFSGIGGFALGLERSGLFRAVAFCEIEPFCRRVLAQHWPGVPVYDDVRTLGGAKLSADGVAVDAICGGFPCQDISFAGRGAGIGGARSGLWGDYARIVGELRPGIVIVENVAALLGRGLGVVLGDLAALGFDAEWHCIPASAVGAPHRRDRIWIVAYTHRAQRGPIGQACDMAGPIGLSQGPEGAGGPRRSGPHVADADDQRQQQPGGTVGQERRRLGDGGPDMADPGRAGLAPSQRDVLFGAGRWEQGRAAAERRWWAAEPDVGRVADGIPARVDRLRSLGNAIVPQIPEIIGLVMRAKGYS